MRPTAPGRPRLPSRRPCCRTARLRGLAVLAGLVVGLTTLGGPGQAAPGAARGGATPTRITSWTAPASVEAGDPLRATATVASRGSDAGRAVALQRRTGSGWATVARSATDRRGRAVLTWRTPAATTTTTTLSLDLRVTVSRTRTKRAATSPARTVRLVSSPQPPTYPGPEAAASVEETLDLVNAARAEPRRCGDRSYPAVGGLALEPRLGRAATGWALRMGTEDFFAHEHDGSTPDQRIEDEGYRWSTWGENIAAGYGTPEATVAAWLRSVGHCTAIMNPSYTEVGVGYVVVDGSRYHDYWVLNFGRPR